MYIAIKEKDTVKIGMSIMEENINSDRNDMALEDNLPIWKIKNHKGCMVAVAKTSFAGMILKYDDKLFDFEINDETIYGGFVNRLQEALKRYDLIDSAGDWNNSLIITNSNDLYEVDRYFTITKITDYSVSDIGRKPLKGCLTFNENMPTEDRIISAIKAIEYLRSFLFYPLSIYDSKTGKRRIIKK